MSERARPTKLKFKGEKTKKKRKHADDDGGEGGSHRRRRREGPADEVEDDTWVQPDNPLEIRGPAFIYHPSDPTPLCMSFDATRGRVMLTPLYKHAKEGEEDNQETEGGILDKTPTDVAQVWVITRVAGSDTVNLRTGIPGSSGETKFLSCDQHGLVSAFREARGPQEEWTPVVLPDGMVAFQNIYEKYLGVDEIAGGTMSLRGDSDEVGFNERFWMKVQAKYKKEAGEEQRKKKEGETKLKIDEASTNRIYQAWGAGRSIVSAEDKKDLKKARKEGRLSEAMLDRRAKLKSDRFC